MHKAVLLIEGKIESNIYDFFGIKNSHKISLIHLQPKQLRIFDFIFNSSFRKERIFLDNPFFLKLHKMQQNQ